MAPCGARPAVAFRSRIADTTPSGRTPARACSNRTDRTAARHRMPTGSRIHAYQGKLAVGMERGLATFVVVVVPSPGLGVGDADGTGTGGLEPPLTVPLPEPPNPPP